jgi:hypothetical protein
MKHLKGAGVKQEEGRHENSFIIRATPAHKALTDNMSKEFWGFFDVKGRGFFDVKGRGLPHLHLPAL